MRIATMIITIIMSIFLFFQAFIAGIGSDISENEDMGAAGGAGLVGSLLWFIGGALVLAFPQVSMVLYGLAAAIMLAVGIPNAEHYGDLQVWGYFSLIFVAMAYLGWRGKRKADAETRQEKARQLHRDEMLEQMMRKQS